MVREGRVFISPPPGDPQYGVGYYVTALEVGAQVAEASSGTDITVRAGHGFAAGDKLIVGTDTTLYREVDSVTATTVKVNSALPVSEGDLLVNLGADLGATEPAFTSPGLTIYTDMDYSNAAANNTVLTDQYGRYRYFHKSVPRWELVRNNSAVPVAIYVDTSSYNLGTGAVNSVGTGVFVHPDAQATSFPDTFTEDYGFGVSVNKDSSVSGATGLHLFRDGLIRWSIGEDYYTGANYSPADRSYFYLWSDKGLCSSGAWTSTDILSISWGGAESQLVGNVPRVTGQSGVDGPKFRFNEVFNQANDQAFSSPFQYEFYCPTLQTGSDPGIWAALFQSALYQHGTTVDFKSGGIQVNVTGVGRPGLLIYNQSATDDNRCAFIETTKTGGTTGFKFGTDILGDDTQNWGVYDKVAGAFRLYVTPDGGLGINSSNGSQFVTAVRTWSGSTLMQMQNDSTNAAATAGYAAYASATVNVHIRAYGTSHATYAGHCGLWAGSSSRLYIGSNALLQHYFDATAPGTFVMAAATTAGASIRLAHGTAPSSPVNGDMWTTTAGLYVRINGSTIGPLS